MRLRFFFDAGSGVCLWAQDDAAKLRFGYPVETSMLDLPADLRRDIEQLVSDYDAAFNWDDPAAVSDDGGSRTKFGYEDNAPLIARVRELLPRLRSALGPAFTIESDYED